MPERIQLKRTKGWRMPPNTVKVDRATKWGNPFPVGKGRPTAVAIIAFRDMLNVGSAKQYEYPSRFEIKEQLAGKNLACWCHPDGVCHADILLKIANS